MSNLGQVELKCLHLPGQVFCGWSWRGWWQPLLSIAPLQMWWHGWALVLEGLGWARVLLAKPPSLHPSPVLGARA